MSGLHRLCTPDVVELGMAAVEILHTPWRRTYVISARDYDGCLLCDLLSSGEDDRARFILHRGKTAFLVLNIYPYTPGHLMAVPYRHVASTLELQEQELAELLELCRLGERLLRRAYGCLSIHGGANLGSPAGAGVPDHLHFHIVAWPAGPLWESCQDEHEPPESIRETYRRLLAVRDD